MVISKLFQKHENEWVLTDRKYSRVILAEKDLGKLQKEAKKQSIKDAVIVFIPPFNASITS